MNLLGLWNSFVREGTGGVAGGRGHPDLAGSAKPGMPATG